MISEAFPNPIDAGPDDTATPVGVGVYTATEEAGSGGISGGLAVGQAVSVGGQGV